MTGERIAGMGGSAGTKKMVTEFHNRHFILRANESARITSEWANKLQELCESEPLGIPAIIASNPRNHITTNASLGTSVGTTVFSSWPGELGLSAMNDLALTREFADIARQEWTAIGLRKGYMYGLLINIELFDSVSIKAIFGIKCAKKYGKSKKKACTCTHLHQSKSTYTGCF